MKKLVIVIVVLALGVGAFLFFRQDFQKVGAEAVDEDGKSYSVVSLTQTVNQNNNYLNTEVSWYDENYNYWVYHLGNINNVPLTTTYTVFTHNGGDISYTREIIETTQNSVQTQLSKSLTSSVSYSSTTSSSVSTSISEGIKDVISVGVETGFSKAITSGSSQTSLWSESVSNCVTNSIQEKNSVTLTFNKNCKEGTYLFLHLGHIKVYGAIIQSRTNQSEIYAQTYGEIYAEQYSLHYNGNSPDFPIDTRKKIDFDLSFVPELKEPSKNLEETFPPITQSGTRVSSQKIKAGQLYFLSLDMSSYFNECYNKGYNKIKVHYKFFAAGAGCHVYGYICYSSNKNDEIYSFEKDPNKSGKWIENTVEGDLRLFTDNKKVYLIIENKENLFSDPFTVEDIIMDITIYKE